MRSLLVLAGVAMSDAALLARQSLLVVAPQGLQGTARRNAHAAWREDARRSAERALAQEVVDARHERQRREAQPLLMGVVAGG